MNRIVLDAESLAKFDGRTVGAEVADEHGNVIGHFLTAGVYERFVEFLFPPVTKEEIALARREMLAVGGVSTDELRAGLDRIKREWEARR